MKASNFFISTLKEAPADAEVASHKLMMRAGMIKKLGAGIYTYMPMGLRVIRKVEAIVREEMNRAGAVELTMPVIQPAELWQETGRFDSNGPELLRIKDRHQRDYIVQPTSEEVITDIGRQEFRSYKQLPKNLYQIQTKFRDERRPRFGLMRGREFTMKDAYSFDRDLDGAKQSYQHHERRLPPHLRPLRPALPRGGGGQRCHRRRRQRGVPGDCRHRRGRHRLLPQQQLRRQHGKGRGAGTGRPPPCRWASPWPRRPRRARAPVKTWRRCWACRWQRTVKSLVLATEQLNERGEVAKVQVWLLLLRGDHELNEIKASKVPGLDSGFRFATVPEIETHFVGCKPGYLGPLNLDAAGEAGGGPRSGRAGRLGLRRQRGRTST